MGKTIFSGLRFVELLKHDPQAAFQYRLDHTGEPIPELYGNLVLDISPNDKIDTDEVLDPTPLPTGGTPVVTQPESMPTDPEAILDPTVESSSIPEEEPKTYTEEDFRKLLKDNNIKFFAGAKVDKLAELCVANNLI